MGVVGLGGFASAGIASAATTPSDDPMSSLVDKISSTFNLDKAKVQQVFDSERTARDTERQKLQQSELQKLVDGGTITSAQKTAIEAKMAEMKKSREADRESMKDLTDDQRKAKMDEKRTEMESWAKENGIDLTKLKGILGGGPGGHGGPGGRHQ